MLLRKQIGILIAKWKIWETYTASAAPALANLDCEKHLLVSSFAIPELGNLEAEEVAQRNLGFEAKLYTEPMRASAKVAARAALCTLMMSAPIDEILLLQSDSSLTT